MKAGRALLFPPLLMFQENLLITSDKLLLLPPQGPLPIGPRLLETLPPGLPIGPLSGRGGGRRSGWWRVAQAQRRAEGAGRAVREAEGEFGPGGSPWREDGGAARARGCQEGHRLRGEGDRPPPFPRP